MSKLRVTMIDVGWGDSILVEALDSSGSSCYGLIDSNDTTTLRSSYIFLKRFFERQGFSIPTSQPRFTWLLLTHAHADHGQGLKKVMNDYGTSHFWYPKTNSHAVFFSDLLRYAQRSSRVVHHQAIDETKVIPPGFFGDVTMKVLSPEYSLIDANENNNSVVLTLTLGNVCFVLTGDAEVDVWTRIADRIPANTLLFKVPHHGSDNGMFDSSHRTPWLDRLSPSARLVISSHIRPFKHPDVEVVNELDSRQIKYYRTDEHYHITFETEGQDISVKYSHFD
jgi:beta-lactamase superfamily II metal-dependent hydrolase